MCTTGVTNNQACSEVKHENSSKLEEGIKFGTKVHLRMEKPNILEPREN